MLKQVEVALGGDFVVTKGKKPDELKEKTRELAAQLKPMDAEVKVVTSKELLYFQCVFALLELNEELAEAHVKAKQVFERAEEPAFMPHISLIYGDLPMETRTQLSRELGPRLDGSKFQLTKLQLWNTTGPVKQWQLESEHLLR